MSDAMLLGVAVVVFGLMLIGIFLTIAEFRTLRKKIGRRGRAPVRPTGAGAESGDSN